MLSRTDNVRRVYTYFIPYKILYIPTQTPYINIGREDKRENIKGDK
tara:strand:- start:318 stop:455 length:138 start_codon:yes stop_codon:yes gene_type:complete